MPIERLINPIPRVLAEVIEISAAKKKPSPSVDREGQEFLKIVTIDMVRHG